MIRPSAHPGELALHFLILGPGLLISPQPVSKRQVSDLAEVPIVNDADMGHSVQWTGVEHEQASTVFSVISVILKPARRQ